ncbi:putative F-box protein At1g23770 [Papaver somniferum]|uniref:putative F-box protein At1g23770 n=1 Tax=Papaver somniferum TaxID=3469 RepID=UPI000E6F744B|nr:putative F-box protein At1g23770 [Papaver somniferum]
MKLRIRSLESKETLKIELPSTSSLQNLKETIAEKISVSSETLQLSLNRKDRIGAAPHDSLQAVGIASGDLIFYTTNPNGFVLGNTQILISSQIRNPNQTREQGESSNNISDLNFNTSDEFLTLAPEEETPNPESSNNNSDLNFNTSDEFLTLAPEEKTPNPINSCEIKETLTLAEEEPMDISDDENPNVVVEKVSSVPCFLKKVLTEEAGISELGDYKLLIIAVHAVFLESGFVAFDPITKTRINNFQLPEGWASKSTLSIQYTVPLLLGPGCGDAVETVVLIFQTLGKFVNAHGSLSRNGKDLYRCFLDKSCYVPSINFAWLSCDSNNAMNIEAESSSNSSKTLHEGTSEDSDKTLELLHEGKIFELCKIAKDKLALPLLIDLCEKTGLSLPPCFTLLPTELKLKVLESLPGVDIGKVACVSSELKYLSSNNELWKQKVVEEFDQSDIDRNKKVHWKQTFVVCWGNKKARILGRRRFPRPNPLSGGIIPSPLFFHHPRRQPRHFPRVIGGDHDIYPGGVVPFGSQPINRFSQRRGVIPDCNLDGFSH